MPHGKPDWGVDWTPRTVYGLQDLGEHAVRLGAIHLWDRRGDVIVLNDFAGGIQGGKYFGGGLNWDVALDTGLSASGAFALKLVAGSTLTHEAYYAWEHGIPVSSRAGFEYAFCPFFKVESLRWIMFWRTPTHRIEAIVEWTFATGVLTYQDDVGGMIPFGTVHLLADMTTAYSVGKIVADYTRRRYVRFIFNDTEHSLLDIPMRVVIDGTGERLEFQSWFYGLLGFNGICYIDNLIVTHNEP